MDNLPPSGAAAEPAPAEVAQHERQFLGIGPGLWMVLLSSWLARGAFLLVKPPTAVSQDVKSWIKVAQLLEQGLNPYAMSSYLNWPPMWMQIVHLLWNISSSFNVSFALSLFLFLIAVESAVIVVSYCLIRRLAPSAPAAGLLLLGIALNPAAILLVCQHGNFDVLVALWVALFVLWLLKFDRSGDAMDWLVACVFLGLGVLSKMVPVVLLPLLAQHAATLPRKALAVGGVLVLGPAALGISILLTLDASSAWINVIGYRSLAGWFGFSGILGMISEDRFFALYGMIFRGGLLIALMGVALLLWRRPLEPRGLALAAAMLLVALPVLGPGYSPQYLYWFLPLLVVSSACYGGRWRRILIGWACIMVATYLVEYSLLESNGALLVKLLAQTRWPWEAGFALRTPTAHVLLRLPLFWAYLVLLVAGARLLVRDSRSSNANAGEVAA